MVTAPPNSPRNLSWDQAIQTVLRDHGKSMHYRDIADEIIKRGLRENVGATPSNTVNSMMNHHYSHNYVWLGNGLYALREWSDNPASIAESATVALDENVDHETGAVNAFGMYWRRDWIDWESPDLIGKQEGADRNVSFDSQIGVYLLHDRERVIYIGRAEDELVKRLKAHTSGRFGGRWDRFSWFGLKSVDEDGSLTEPEIKWTRADVIETMEAVLIECLEPSQNRRRGDNLGESEFVQVLATNFRRNEARRLLDRLISENL